MARYERTIQIDAPPSAVWAVMANLERWPEWTPTILELLTDGALGSGSTARVTPKGRREGVWRVTEFLPERSFTWETGAGPALRVVAGHVVEPADRGSRGTLTITPAGPAAPLVGWLVARMSKSNVDTEAESLKRRVEQLTRDI